MRRKCRRYWRWYREDNWQWECNWGVKVRDQMTIKLRNCEWKECEMQSWGWEWNETWMRMVVIEKRRIRDTKWEWNEEIKGMRMKSAENLIRWEWDELATKWVRDEAEIGGEEGEGNMEDDRKPENNEFMQQEINRERREESGCRCSSAVEWTNKNN